MNGYRPRVYPIGIVSRNHYPVYLSHSFQNLIYQSVKTHVFPHNTLQVSKQGMAGIRAVADFVFNGFFLQVTSLGKVVQFYSDGIGRFSKLLSQTTEVAIVVGIDKKLDQ